MNYFYYTMGNNNPDHAFSNGWVVVYAEDLSEAHRIFAVKHPRCGWGRKPLFAKVYTQQEFVKTKMAQYGNYGGFCQESLGIKMWRRGE